MGGLESASLRYLLVLITPLLVEPLSLHSCPLFHQSSLSPPVHRHHRVLPSTHHQGHPTPIHTSRINPVSCSTHSLVRLLPGCLKGLERTSLNILEGFSFQFWGGFVSALPISAGQLYLLSAGCCVQQTRTEKGQMATQGSARSQYMWTTRVSALVHEPGRGQTWFYCFILT